MADDYASRGIHFSNPSRLASSGDTSNPRPAETWSVFGDYDCGEPLFPQHLVLDFTPNENDNDIVQKKVCSFWQLINNTPEIQNLKVKPKKELYNDDSDTGIRSASVRPRSKPDIAQKVEVEEAVEMLKFVEEKNLVATSMTNYPHDLFPVSSYEEDLNKQPKKQKKIKHVCKCTPCPHPKCRNKRASAVSKDDLVMQELNLKMDEWDAKHPKSMEPPGQVPPLQHCLIQRQVFPGPP